MSHQDNLDRRPKEGLKEPTSNFGPFTGIVVNNLDAEYMGTIRVQIMHEGSNGSRTPGEIVSARYMSAYWGTTGTQFNGTADTFQDTQTSWGMWVPTPEIGTQVVVIYVEGSASNAFWIGAFPDRDKNFMVPGAPATTYNASESGKRLPVGEFNTNTTQPGGPATSLPKPKHLLANVFEKQGVLQDDIRGITTSGARRETPSKVFGFSTPGPVDTTAPKKNIGTKDNAVNIPIARLGGSTFVMDDGDPKYVRKTLASDGPPEYVSASSGSGIPDALHNELVRLRTRTGHQILLHNTEDLIYIGNAKGTTWIELTSQGKIDIFAEDSISIHTKADLNFRADRDVNLEAGRNVNIKGTKLVHVEGTVGVEVLSNSDTKITSLGNLYLKTQGNHIEKAAQVLMNTAEAIPVIPLVTFTNPTPDGTPIPSIMLRVPTHEPYPHHENLDPLSFTALKTDRMTGSVIPVPKAWKQYTAPDDTFKQGR